MSKQLLLPFPLEVEWRKVPGFEDDYEVSNTGLIRRLRSKKGGKAGMTLHAKPSSSTGYIPVSLRTTGRIWKTHVHRVVMLAFVGEPVKGIHVNHKNGVRHDNRLENLEYCTPGENIRHAIDVLGRKIGYSNEATRVIVRGVEHGNAKLDDDKVREIRRLAADGMKATEIGIMFGIDWSNVYYVLRRKTWTHVD